MPYLIINDKTPPTRYCRGGGFTIAETTDDQKFARHYEHLEEATSHIGGQHNRGDLYGNGWRVVPIAWPRS